MRRTPLFWSALLLLGACRSNTEGLAIAEGDGAAPSGAGSAMGGAAGSNLGRLDAGGGAGASGGGAGSAGSAGASGGAIGADAGLGGGSGGSASAVDAGASGGSPDARRDAAGGAAQVGDAGPAFAGTWELAPTLPGGARQEVAVVGWKHLVFVLGGLGNAAGHRNEAFNTQTGQWETHTPLPQGTGVDHGMAAATDAKVYVMGGNLVQGGGQANRALEYDPVTKLWTERAPMPTARSAGASAALGNKIYVVGGGGDDGRIFEAFDASANTWEKLPELPGPGRNHLAVVGLEGLLYVIAGRTGGPADGLQARLDVYDPPKRAWSLRAPAPTARGGIGAGVVNGRIYVVGGEGAPRGQFPTGVFPMTESYDPATDRWATHARMRTPRHGMGAAGIGGKLYVPAGATMQGGGTQVMVMEIFVP